MHKSIGFARILIVAMLVCLYALVAGCASSGPRPDANYAAYLDLISKQQAADDARIAGIAATASACTDARCVEHVAAVAALAAAGGRDRPMPEPYREQPSLGKQLALALVGQVAPLASAAVNWHQSDNARRSTEAQYAYLGSVLTTALTGMRDASIKATPSVTVGGNYGDTYGDDYTGGDRSDTSVAGPQINGDGNVVGDRNYNDGQQDSTGCDGETCQPGGPEPTP